jgi:hypothetical protein
MATKKTKSTKSIKSAPVLRNAEPYKNSAGVKLPNADLIIEAEASGTVTSCRDAVTGTEYVGGGGGDITTVPVLPQTTITASEWTAVTPQQGFTYYEYNTISENTDFPDYLYVKGGREPVIATKGNEGEIDGEIAMTYEGVIVALPGVTPPNGYVRIVKSETSGKLQLTLMNEQASAMANIPDITLQIDQIVLS